MITQTNKLVIAAAVTLSVAGVAAAITVVTHRTSSECATRPIEGPCRTAESDLRNALAAAKTCFTDSTGACYASFTPAQAASVEPSLRWAGDVPARVGVVSIDMANTAGVVMSTRAPDGTCFCIADNPTTRTRYGHRDAVGATTAAACGSATDPGSGW